MSVVRLAAVWLAVAAAALAAGVDPARACSCAREDPRTVLAQADAAFVGTLLERRGAATPRSSADAVTLVFRVVETVKGRLGATVEVVTAASGASCGVEARIGQTIGLFLDRDGGVWRSNLCRQVAPAELRAAARPLPRPNGRGPVAFLVGGRFGQARTLALDARGRTLAYGRGAGETFFFSPCPGSRRVVEIASAGRATTLAVRDLRTFRVVRARPLALPRGIYPTALSCRDRRGQATLVFETSLDFPERARIVRVRGRSSRTVWRGTALAAVFSARVAYVSAGRRGSALLAVDLASGRASRVAGVPRFTGDLAVSPDGGAVAGIAYSAPVRRVAPPSRVVVVRVDGTHARVRTAPLAQANVTGDVLWLGPERLAFLPDGEINEVRVYDRGVRLRSRFDGWRARGGVLRAGRVYGVDWNGRLLAARLPRGPVGTVRALPSRAAHTLAAVPPPER